jgi:epoxide hydrolase-like predicted phosphatase
VTVRAIVFDIGGVLEIDPDIGVAAKWEAALGLGPGGLGGKLGHLWAAGSVGQMTLVEVHQGIRDALGVDEDTVEAMMSDIWTQYLGTLNSPLYEYFRALRPRFVTGILSNSFVGAREREQALYGFEDACDLIIYSHEVGMSKPDERIFHLTWTRLGVKPEELVFVDDHPPNIEAAGALGIAAVHFRDNVQAINEIEKHIGAY